MPESEAQSLRDLILKVKFQYPGSIDFAATDGESIHEIVRRLTDAALVFNLLAISEFGGRSGQEREPGLVSSKVGSAFQTWDGLDLHPDPFEKAAVLIEGIVRGHPSKMATSEQAFF